MEKNTAQPHTAEILYIRHTRLQPAYVEYGGEVYRSPMEGGWSVYFDGERWKYKVSGTILIGRVRGVDLWFQI